MNEPKKFKCVICKKFRIGWGNNPAPVKFKGRCCDQCNLTEVIPVRLGIKTTYEK